MTNLTRSALLRDHATIEALARRLANLVEVEADAATLSNVLAALVGVVREHLETENLEIYTLALESWCNADRDEIRCIQEDFERLKVSWNDYLTLWSEEQIATDPAGFAQATRTTLRKLRDRVAFENRLLAIVGLIPNPCTAPSAWRIASSSLN